jgi:hypothetical protein
MSRSRKVRNRKFIVSQMKPPIRAKALGLQGNESLSTKNRTEIAQRRERKRALWHEEFRREARKETPHLPLGRLESEQVAIDSWSDAMAQYIVAYLRNAPVEICLIRGGLDHGKADKRQPRFAPIRITSFAALVAALEQSQARDQA